jgi:hypothetical protein
VAAEAATGETEPGMREPDHECALAGPRRSPDGEPVLHARAVVYDAATWSARAEPGAPDLSTVEGRVDAVVHLELTHLSPEPSPAP